MITNEVLDNLEYVTEGGALLYRGIRYLLIRPETMVEFQKSMESDLNPDTVGTALYRAGKRGGSATAACFMEEFGIPSQEITRFMAQIGGKLGWGCMEISAVDHERGTLELEVFHSPFAESYGPASYPVCHMIRGVFAGAWGGAINREVDGLETCCRSVEGPGPCKFIFAPTPAHSGLNVTFGEKED
ncbi:MAG: hypothetical protein NTW14_04175 [bacterium]|nr:hypothetical protein [bacterium]